MNVRHFLRYTFILVSLCAAYTTSAQTSEADKRVLKVLEENKNQWQDLNVPSEDGKVLYDLIIKNSYQSAIEIGTSTGHSTLWIAWALSKTGGKLTTFEIDENRQKKAMENIRKAGLSDYVTFMLGDAHQKVKEVNQKIDFVFSDADKDWYIQYFKDLDPKMKKGGAFTAHNVLQNLSGIREFRDFVEKHPGYSTTIDRTSSSGISISIKK